MRCAPRRPAFRPVPLPSRGSHSRPFPACCWLSSYGLRLRASAAPNGGSVQRPTAGRSGNWRRSSRAAPRSMRPSISRASCSGSAPHATCGFSTILATTAIPPKSPKRPSCSRVLTRGGAHRLFSIVGAPRSYWCPTRIRCSGRSRRPSPGAHGAVSDRGRRSNDFTRRDGSSGLLSVPAWSATQGDHVAKGTARMKIAGSVALVTGGASGLGEATARELVKRGAHVAIVDRPQSEGERVAKELSGLFCAADVTSGDQVDQAVAKTVERFAGIQIVVNCAGVGTAARTVTKQGPMPLEIFKKTVEINLVGSFNVIRLAAARMSEGKPNEEGERGVIINTASAAAFDGQIGQASYSASKGGVVGMTLPIARDLASLGIRCMTIAPGTFDTPMLALLPEEARQALAKDVPFPKRLGRPAEFAALACHLIENAMLNGETIRLDGAIRMPPK